MSGRSRAGHAVSDAVARRIRKRRRELELSQEQLADKSGLPRNIFCNLETRRKQHITLDELAAVATALDCLPSDLWPALDSAP